jgi:hypothetical protein
MKLLLKAIPYIIMAIMATAIALQQVHIKSLKKHRTEQGSVITAQAAQIAELLKLKTYSYQFEVKLSVQDKSKYNIYGRNNAGTIIAPNLKQYELKIDSTSFINLKLIPEKQ